MKETEELQRTNDVETELIEEASAFTVKRKKTWKVFLTIAASVLLVVGVLFGWLYSNSNKVELDENGKIDIYSIKGEKIKDQVPESYNLVWSEEDEPALPEEYVAWMKEEIEKSNEAVVYGTAKNIKTITLEDHVHFSRKVRHHFLDGTSTIIEKEYDYPVVWWIVTFDIDVIDDLGILDGEKTVHAVMATRYATAIGSTNDDPYFKLHCPTEMKEILEKMKSNPTGAFLLMNLTEMEDERLDDSWEYVGNIWEINGEEYRADEFADYFFRVRYDCDGEKFQYASSELFTIYLDELRIQKEE